MMTQDGGTEDSGGEHITSRKSLGEESLTPEELRPREHEPMMTEVKPVRNEWEPFTSTRSGCVNRPPL